MFSVILALPLIHTRGRCLDTAAAYPSRDLFRAPGGYTGCITHASVTIQITPEPSPSTPSWMGEVAAFAQVLSHMGILKAIQEQVRFARARFGTYDLIDFAVVLIGYILSGEPTLLAFYERLAPFAEAYMALFGRNQLPHRSTLSRFLAALDQPTVEALSYAASGSL